MTKPSPPAPLRQAPKEQTSEEQHGEILKNGRPQRVSVCAEDGRNLTLAAGAEAFICLNGDEAQEATAALVLGLGPSAGNDLATALEGCTDVLWLDAPVLVANLEKQETEWTARIPTGWQALIGQGDTSQDNAVIGALLGHVGQADQAVLADQAELANQAAHATHRRRVYWHTQNLHLFPSFWGPILGAVQAALLGLTKARPATSQATHAAAGAYPPPHTVLLPGDAHSLLHQELAEAFAAQGLTVRTPDATGQGAEHGMGSGNAACQNNPLAMHAPRLSLHDLVRAQIRQERPALFFSVNGRGLDAQGVNFALLRACDIPVALWLVDNPWHILSAWRQGWWREAHIFVTDHSFIPDLKKAGASHVHHLPLAAAQHMTAFRQQRMAEEEMRRPDNMPAFSKHPASAHEATKTLIHFVGRASFPAKDKFFAASRVPEHCMEHAQTLLNAATHPSLPDFHWWTRNLAVPLWPGYEVRSAGLGAERCAAVRRARWLASALPLGLTVHGDEEAWRTLLPKAPPHTFQPPVDYYAALPSIYAHAPYNLNITSLLLPAGLTQRHFDVWAAGGFLLSDATRGLDIFAAELTQEIRLAGPHCLPDAVNRLERDPLLRRHLQEAWQAHLASAHTYAHRVRTVLETTAR